VGASSDAAVRQRQTRIQNRNFIVNVMDGAFYSFGLAFITQQTLLPVFVKKIGGGNIAIGLIPVLWMLGFNLPQILIASQVQGLRLKKRFFLKTSLFQRLPWLLMALLCWFILGRVSPAAGVLLFLALFTAAAVAGSINLPVWFDLLAKVTPVVWRGRLFALRLILGGILGIVAGIVAKKLLEIIAFPANFGLLFLLAFAAMMASWAFLTLLKEPRGRIEKAPVQLGEYLRSLPGILRGERNYRHFLIADALQYLAVMANAFFTVHALAKFSLHDSAAGIFTAIMMASTIAGTLFFGYLADHHGQRINLCVSALCMAVACGLALVARSIGVYYLVFVASALAAALTQISRLPIIAEFCSEAQRPTYIALASLISTPFILAGIAGGWLVNRFGYEILFILAGCFALLALTWLLLMVHEPRRISQD